MELMGLTFGKESYETFFDEYIALMEKADTMEYLDLLDEYMEYLEQYTVVLGRLVDEDYQLKERQSTKPVDIPFFLYYNKFVQ